MGKNHKTMLTHLDTPTWRSYHRNCGVGPVVDAISPQSIPQYTPTLIITWEFVSAGTTKKENREPIGKDGFYWL
jgi:hypothetical protein